MGIIKLIVHRVMWRQEILSLTKCRGAEGLSVVGRLSC